VQRFSGRKEEKVLPARRIANSPVGGSRPPRPEAGPGSAASAQLPQGQFRYKAAQKTLTSALAPTQNHAPGSVLDFKAVPAWFWAG